MRSLLVCAAVDAELAALPEELRGRQESTVPPIGIGAEAGPGAAVRREGLGLTVATIGIGADVAPGTATRRERLGLTVAPIGIGPVEAALGASELFFGGTFDLAVLLGTCGALPGSGLSIGDVVAVERSVLTSSDAAAGFSYVPGPMQGAVFSDRPLLDELAPGLRRVGCATVVAITRDRGHAEAEAQATGCQIEHLEAHAFLRAAERANVPAVAILGVANHVGPDAHREWLAHGDRAAAAAVEALLLAL